MSWLDNFPFFQDFHYILSAVANLNIVFMHVPLKLFKSEMTNVVKKLLFSFLYSFYFNSIQNVFYLIQGIFSLFLAKGIYGVQFFLPIAK